MIKESKKEEVKVEVKKEAKLKYKVVSIGDYLPKALELLRVGKVNGSDDKWNTAMSLLYEDNVIAPCGNVMKGGEQRFIVEA